MRLLLVASALIATTLIAAVGRLIIVIAVTALLAATLLTALIELFSARRELQRIGAVAGGTGDA